MISEEAKREREEGVNWEHFGLIFLSHWYYFVASVIVAMVVAIYYVMQTTPIYTRSAQLLIKDDEKGATSSAAKDFKDLGLVASTSNISNEILTISAPVMMDEVVKRLRLDLQMEVKDGLHSTPLYNDAPVHIVTPSPLPEDMAFRFKLVITKGGKVEMSDFEMEENKSDKTITTSPDGSLVQTPIGKIGVEKTPSWNTDFIGREITVHKYPVKAIAAIYGGRLSVSLSDKESTVINLTVNDENPDRAGDVIMTLVDVYNEKWVKDKNRVAESTNQFITERLEAITKELGDVDERISDYKSANLLPDVAASLAKDMQQSSKNYDKLLELQNQLSMTRYVREYLTDKSKGDQLLPAGVGLPSSGIEGMIEEYNRMLLERMNFVENSDANNPTVRDLDRRLSSQKTAITRSVDNLIEQLRRQIAGIQGSEREINGQIASQPGQVKALQSIERQQKVKEALYIFLLQKREENELSRTYTAWNTSVIQPPIGSDYPTSPRRNMILLVAFVIGLVLPAVLLYLRETLNHTVRGRRDLEIIDVPLVGEIPDMYEKRHWWQRRQEHRPQIVISEGKRNIINESFRLVRTKLEYFIGQPEQTQVVMLTSFNPGSGKSFISANLGVTYAISGKRVLVVDADVRHYSLSNMLAHKAKTGFTSYLSGMENDVENLILKDAFQKGCDVLPVGIVPPNPTELLQSQRMETLFAALRQRYDLILLDCPPIEIVADAGIIKKYADVTIFVVRAGLMDRRVLGDVEELYKENKYNKLGILLNGTEYVSGKYGSYRYGYSYGYHYGYGYGYHDKD